MATELPPITVTPGDVSDTPGNGGGSGSSGGDRDYNPTPAGVTDLDGQSQYYLVIITSSRYGDVHAWLPDGIRVWIKSSWGPVVGNVESSLANYLGTQFGPLQPGTTFFSEKLTAQAWKGVEPLSLQLPLHFFATSDASRQVIDPIKRLMKMSLPRKINDNFYGLQPPGPFPNLAPGFISDGVAQQQADIINVYIGNFISLKGVFIDQISGIQFNAKLSKDGLPMEGLCEVIFKTTFAVTSQDVDLYLSANTIQGPPQAGQFPSGRPIITG